LGRVRGTHKVEKHCLRITDGMFTSDVSELCVPHIVGNIHDHYCESPNGDARRHSVSKKEYEIFMWWRQLRLVDSLRLSYQHVQSVQGYCSPLRQALLLRVMPHKQSGSVSERAPSPNKVRPTVANK
jgi:hypothetical protein